MHFHIFPKRKKWLEGFTSFPFLLYIHISRMFYCQLNALISMVVKSYQEFSERWFLFGGHLCLWKDVLLAYHSFQPCHTFWLKQPLSIFANCTQLLSIPHRRPNKMQQEFWAWFSMIFHVVRLVLLWLGAVKSLQLKHLDGPRLQDLLSYIWLRLNWPMESSNPY